MERKWVKPTRPNHCVQLGTTIYGPEEQGKRRAKSRVDSPRLIVSLCHYAVAAVNPAAGGGVSCRRGRWEGLGEMPRTGTCLRCTPESESAFPFRASRGMTELSSEWHPRLARTAGNPQSLAVAMRVTRAVQP